MKTPLKQNELDLTKEQIDSMSQEDWDNLPIVTGPKPKKKKQPWEVMDAHNIHAAKTNDPIGGGDPPITDTIKLSDKDLSSTKNVSPNYRDDLPKLSAHKVPSWMKIANIVMPTYANIAKKILMPDSSSRRSYEYDHEKQVDLDETKNTISQRPIDQWRKVKTKAQNKIKRAAGFKQQEEDTTTTVPQNTFNFDEYMRTKALQAKETQKKYADVMFKGSGKPIISSDKPWRLIASNKFNQPYGAGNVMDHLVEIGKNVLIPGRFAKKLKRAYDYHKHTKQPPY